ncbi:MAG: hypothetical protein PVF51_11745 [Nitrospirota bacterium]|jgi:hypothetical protein
MEYTEEQKAQFREQYATRRRRQYALTVSLVAVFAGLFFLGPRYLGRFSGLSVTAIVPISFLLVAGALIFSLRNWRCPACNRYLGRTYNPRYCQGCGFELRKS